MLVQTRAAQELRAYISAPRFHGGIYLVVGKYGAGKTTLLNALPSFAESPIHFQYHDLSLCKSSEELKGLFKNTVIPKVEKAIHDKLNAVIALDQLHNLDTSVATQFFRDRQTDFEKLKEHRVALVFAGDERFQSLSRSGGPLGAIFDADFVIPPFEQELATQLLARRLEAAAEKPSDLLFPFLEDSIVELVRVSGGNPRLLIDSARRVLRYGASRPAPIRLTRFDVRSATAEVTEEALDKARHELRTPALGNSLAKLVKLLGEPRGSERIHDLSRLLDLALERPLVSLESLCNEVAELSLRPDVVVDTLAGLGLTESQPSMNKTRLGTTFRRNTFLSKQGHIALASVRKETGLLPSQYFVRLAEEGTVSPAYFRRDALRVAMEGVQSRMKNERASNFLGRALVAYTAIFSDREVSPEGLIDFVRNVSRAISLDLVGDPGGSVKDVLGRVIALRETDRALPSADGLVSQVDRWEELRSVYEDRGANWTQEELRDAEEAARAVARVLIQVHNFRTLGSPDQEVASPAPPPAEKLSSDFAAEARIWLERQNLPSRPSLEEMARRLSGQLVELAKSTRGATRESLEFVQRALEHVDRLVYSREIENQPAHLQGQLAALLDILTVHNLLDEPGVNDATKQAAALVAHINEHGRSLVGLSQSATRLSSAIHETLLTEGGRTEFARVEGFVIKPGEKASIQASINGMVRAYKDSAGSDERSDAAVVLWYFLRNATHHSTGQYQLLPVRAELARSLLTALTAALCRVFVTEKQPYAGVALLKKRTGRFTYLIETSKGTQHATSAADLVVPDLVGVSTTMDPSGFDDSIWSVRRPVSLQDLDTSSSSQTALLPGALGMGLDWFRKRKNYIKENEIHLFQASIHSDDGRPIAFYSQSGRPKPAYLKSLGDDEKGEKWLQALGRERKVFLGGVTDVGMAEAEIIPFIAMDDIEAQTRIGTRLGFRLSRRFLAGEQPRDGR